MSQLDKIVQRLCDLSVENYLDPSQQIDWPSDMPQEQWFVSPELLSLYGTEVYESLSEAQQQRLSFFEAVNFFSLNIHGEKPLVEGLAQRLYRRATTGVSPYLHHFLDEENKHMMYFAGFCLRYAGKIYTDKKMTLPTETTPVEADFLFFAKVLIFEELVDVYNRTMARDDRLEPTVRRINHLHHAEETRHLAFGRTMVQELFERCRAEWSPHKLRAIRKYLDDYLQATWKEYYNPEVYRDAGLEEALRLRDAAFGHANQVEHRKRIESTALRFLRDSDILPGGAAA